MSTLPELPPAMVIYSWDKPQYKGFTPADFSINPNSFTSVFGIPGLTSSDDEDNNGCNILAWNARPLAVASPFKNCNLRTLPIYIVRRQVDENGDKSDDKYEPYGPCRIVSITGEHHADFTNVTISGPRGEETRMNIDRIFAIVPDDYEEIENEQETGLN